MRTIHEVTVLIKKRSFPGFVDELYRRDCDLMELQHIEETGEGHLYTIRVGSGSVKRFSDFITIIGSAADKYRIISYKNVIEEGAVGGLLAVTGRVPLETVADFNTSLLGAAELVRSRAADESGVTFTSIARNVALVTGIGAGDEAWKERLVRSQVDAERDAVILGRFTGLNGIPLAVRCEHPEDIVKVLKKTEGSFSAVRIMRVDGATMMLYELIHNEISIPLVSLEYDDVPLLLLALVIRMMLKYRLKPEEATVGFAGIDCSAVRLTRVLDRLGFRRILGADPGEKAMLALENQGGLATTVENIFTNADITILIKEEFDREEYRTVRPGQLVISLLDDEESALGIISDKGVREFVRSDMARLASLFPGVVKGVIQAGLRSINDAMIVEYAKKLAALMNESFEFPPLFGEIHDRVCGVITAEGAAADRPRR